MQQLVLDLARVTNQPIPAFSGELADTETLQPRLALGRALLLVEVVKLQARGPRP